MAYGPDFVVLVALKKVFAWRMREAPGAPAGRRAVLGLWNARCPKGPCTLNYFGSLYIYIYTYIYIYIYIYICACVCVEREREEREKREREREKKR